MLTTPHNPLGLFPRFIYLIVAAKPDISQTENASIGFV